MHRLRTLSTIVKTGVIAVIRAECSGSAARIAEACAEGGITALEVTFTVPNSAKVIEDVTRRFEGSNIIVGAGTVLDPETARIAILSGARFVVSPALNGDTARLCNRYQIPYLPGAATIRDIIEALESGADLIKVFPGETLDPTFIKAVRGPVPQASLVPTGGVSIENVRSWIQAGAAAVGVGGCLTAGAKTGDYASVTKLAAEFVDSVQQAREQCGQ
jgi:2-dehydro-3-deoxyphosphogluconate aldolase/(4S)-4-hydroxy-2-oxoglutarate aldolase